MKYYAHESAIIDSGAVIGDDTKIWHFSHVMPRAVIGKNCSLGQNVYVANNVTIGEGVKIQNNVSIYEGVTLEEQVFCGPSMVFTNVRNPRSPFPVGGAAGFHKTLVRKGATLGANCTIVCGTEIGEWAFVAAGAVVTKDVKPYSVIGGVPGRVIGYACQCGEVFKKQEIGSKFSCKKCLRDYTYDREKELIKHV